MLRKIGTGFIAGVVCFLTTQSVSAQITIEGQLSVRSVYRDNVYDFLDARPIPGTTTEAGADDEHFWDTQLDLTLGAALSGKVDVVTTLTSQFVWGLDDASANTSDQSRTEVREAYIRFQEFISPNVTMFVGLQTIAYDLRGDGNNFFLNTSERENRRWLEANSVFVNQPATITGTTTPGFGFAPSSSTTFSPAGSPVVSQQVGDGRSSAAGALKFVYDADPIFVDFFYAQLEETFTGQDDHWVAGFVVDYLLGEDSILRGHLLYFKDEGALDAAKDADATNVFTVGNISFFQAGLGVSYIFDFGNPLEVYGEFGYQSGDFGQTTDLTGALFDVDHTAVAFNFGLKYTWQNVSYVPWIDISYWFTSADSDATDGDQEGWIPYGDVDDMMIFEENHYGLGVNSGYSAIKFKAGFKPSQETGVELRIALFTASESTFRVNNGGNLLQLNYEDTIGQEFDLLLNWDYTEDVTFSAGAGFMAGEAFLDDAVDADGNIDAGNALMIDFGVNARF